MNPYAPPQASWGPQVMPMGAMPPQAFYAHVDGDRLTMPKHWPLPGMCVKCGRHDSLMPRHQQFSWFPQWTYLLLLGGLLPAALVQMMLTKKAPFVLPVCAWCNSRWTAGRVLYVLSVLLPIVIGIATLFVAAAQMSSTLAILGGVILLPGMIVSVVAVQYLVLFPRIVRTTFIDDHVITLVGLSPDVLAVFMRPPGT
jgi:hypothetical protein